MNQIVTTQKFFNYFLDNILVTEKNKLTTRGEDGIFGAMSRDAEVRALWKLKAEFRKRNWEWQDFNFIGIRTDLDLDNTFDDWFVLVAYNAIIAVPASTVSGLQGIWKYWNRWFYGKQGVASIAHNQQIDYLLVEPTDKSFWNPQWTGGLGFLYQDKPIDLFMGAKLVNGVWQIDINNLVTKTQGSGHNIHSWLNALIQFVNNLSEGCQVTTADYWQFVVFPFLKKMAKNKRVIYSLMKL